MPAVQPPAKAAEENFDSPRKLIYAGIGAILVLVLAVAGWAALAPVSGAVIAAGSVKVDMYRRTVQHQEGGIVGEILVRDGTKVKAGDPLITLRDVKVDAAIEMVLTQLDGEMAKVARLQAEQAWAGKIDFPAELMKRASDPRIGEVLRRETSLFNTRREAYDSQLALIRAQIGDIRGEIAAREAQIRADRDAVRYARSELESNRKLQQEGFISQTRILAFERNLADVEARLGEHQAELAAARGRASDLQLKAENLRTTMMQEAANELRNATGQLLDLRERLRPLQDAETRQKITAPIGGEVVALKVTTIGAVIGPRDPILDIVPEDIELVIEARVRPEDINYVAVGAPADVRLDRVQAADHAGGRGRGDLHLGRPAGGQAGAHGVLRGARARHRRGARQGRRAQAAGRHAGRGLHQDRGALGADVRARPDTGFPRPLAARAGLRDRRQGAESMMF